MELSSQGRLFILSQTVYILTDSAPFFFQTIDVDVYKKNLEKKKRVNKILN